MPEKMDKNHPVIQKEIHALVDEAMRARGIDLEDPVRGNLLSRVDVHFGFHDQPLVLFRAPDNSLLSASACLDNLLNDTEHSTDTPSGPTRIHYTDKEAVLGVDIEKVARGEVVVYDDRRHPR
jgi:hypothetical protein